METHKGQQVPVVKEFQAETVWVPVTPVKPNLARQNPGPIYGNSHGGLLTQVLGTPELFRNSEDFMSKCIDQNQAQNLLSYSISSTDYSYPTTSNLMWGETHGAPSLSGRIHLQRENDDIVQRRGLEAYLPHSTSQGRRSVATSVGTTRPSSSKYPSFSSWERSQLPWTDGRVDVASILESDPGAGPMGHCSFRDILSMGDTTRLEDTGSSASTYGMSGMSGISVTEWLSQNQVAGMANGTTFSNRDTHGMYHQNRAVFHQEEQIGALNQKCWRDGSVYSPLTAKYVGGRCSTFAPPTPDSMQRMESNTATWKSAPGTNVRPDEQNVLPEHEVAAAMINLQSNHNMQAPGPITDSTQGEVSKEMEETHNPENEENEGNNGIDLNKAPQKKNKRRRYLPKVIRENKPKRTPKPKTPKPAEPEDTKGRRKYVRKNKVKTPSTSSPGEATETIEPKPAEPAAKSCRKSLNFDLNGHVAEDNSFHMSNGGLDVEPQADGSPSAGDKIRLPELFSHVEEPHMKVSMLVTAYDLNCDENQQIRDYMSLPQKENPDSSLTDMSFVPRHKKGTSSLYTNKADMRTRGSKRSSSYMDDITDATAATVDAHQSIICQHANTDKLPYGFIPEACKKKRTDKVQRSHTTSTSSPAAASEDLSRMASNPHHLGVNLNRSNYLQCGPSPFRANTVTTNQAKVSLGSSATEHLMSSWAALNRLKKRRSKRARNPAPQAGSCSQMIDTKNEPYSCTPKSIGVQSCTEALALDTKATPRSKRTSAKQDDAQKKLELVVYGSNQSTRKAAGSTSARRPATVDKITQLLKRLDINAKVRRDRKVRKIPSREQNAIVPYNISKHEYNALVPYERDGTIVPFEGPFNPIRKRRQRAKVDLDDETTRVWRLLLENIDNQGIDGTDEDKAKWWENERRVFRGRVDSFIARMRLVQGDRRFTPWKGSVLDSVIGVFLTQNVSDHLSSSAFMSMAARFPFKTQSNRSSLSEESSSALAVEPDMYVIEPEESITWNEKTVDQPTLDINSALTQYINYSEEKEVVSCRELIQKASPASPAECFTETCGKFSNESRTANSQTAETDTDTGSIIRDDKARDDATSPQQSVISSQNSINSPNLSAAGMKNTLCESTTRAQATSSHCSFSFMEMLKAAEKPLLNESYSQMHHQLEGIWHVTEFPPEMTGVSSSNYQFNLKSGFHLQDTKGIEMLEVESRSSDMSRKDENSPATEQSNLTTETTDQQKSPDSISGGPPNMRSYYVLEGETMVMQSVEEPLDTIAPSAHAETSPTRRGIHLSSSFQKTSGVTESTTVSRTGKNNSKDVEQIPEANYATGGSDTANGNPGNLGKGKAGKGKKNEFDWDSLRREARANGKKTEQTPNTRDSLDWEAVRRADVKEIADTIKERGMNNMLAERIKDLLDRLVRDHGSIDLEWLRDIPPDKAKEYLLSFRGLGLKSVECVRLLTLHHLAFPVDTNVGRIAVRLGWVPLQPLPESLQLHLLEMYPILESIQQYLWPRLCKLDQKTLYELHYHMITFGKVFCTKRQPNCNACPLRGECRHFASAFASARFSLPGPEERSIIPSSGSNTANVNSQASINLLHSASWSNHGPQRDSRFNDARTMHVSSSPLQLQMSQTVHLERKSINSICEPIVECPASPEPETQQEQVLGDIEDSYYEDPNEIPTIQLNMKEFTQTLQSFMHANSELQEAGMSNELVALTPEAASIPTPKLKNINRLRTEHHVYELPDTHPLLQDLDRREPDDPCSYLLAIWTPGETANSIEPPARRCISDDPSIMCNEETCSYCSSLREASSQIVRGTLLIPCRTAMRGSFPLNGTYFQVNEVFADHDSSLDPIAVPRSWLWNLPRRTVYFGTSIPTIFKGLNTEDIQHCFWRGYVCVRGFDQKKRAPRPLMARLHFPASRMARGAKGKATTYNE